MVPLVIAPAGGMLGADGDPVTVQRTFATARSVEFDALLLAGAPGAGQATPTAPATPRPGDGAPRRGRPTRGSC